MEILPLLVISVKRGFTLIPFNEDSASGVGILMVRDFTSGRGGG